VGEQSRGASDPPSSVVGAREPRSSGGLRSVRAAKDDQSPGVSKPAALRSGHGLTAQLVDHIRRLRTDRRWSTRELAERCLAAGAPSLTRSILAKVESGARPFLTLQEVDGLSAVFGVPPDELIRCALALSPVVAASPAASTLTGAVLTSTQQQHPAITPPGLIPVYMVLDESLHDHLPHIEYGIRHLYESLIASPEIASVIRLSVLGYADEVDLKQALQLIDPRTPVPRMRPSGPPRYAAAFQRLLECIPRDVQTLKAQNRSVRRPQVLFLTGSQPADGTAWVAVHEKLVDRAVLPVGPDIVAWGVGDVAPGTVLSVASRPEYAFVPVDGDVGWAIRQLAAFVKTHVFRYGRAILDREQGPIILPPPGFRRVQ
jgi:uncharacterized protein YegL